MSNTMTYKGYSAGMRNECRAIALIGLIGFVSVANTQEFPTSDQFLNLPENCWTTSDADRCEEVKSQWAEIYNKAIEGDPIAQFDVAFCLSNGCVMIYFGYLKQNPVLGCAWQITIASKQGLEARTDTLQAYCSEPFVNSAGLQLAQKQAEQIARLLVR